jgi:hypothetical protein
MSSAGENTAETTCFQCTPRAKHFQVRPNHTIIESPKFRGFERAARCHLALVLGRPLNSSCQSAGRGCDITGKAPTHRGRSRVAPIIDRTQPRNMTNSAPETVFDPSANDPRIVAALDARKRLVVAMLGGDLKAVEMICASDLVVHSPINKIVDRDEVLARLRSGRIAYESHVEEKFEFVGVRGNSVVIMGEEIVQPIGNAPNAGKTVRRRITDIWKGVDGAWKLCIRQATVTTIE